MLFSPNLSIFLAQKSKDKQGIVFHDTFVRRTKTLDALKISHYSLLCSAMISCIFCAL